MLRVTFTGVRTAVARAAAVRRVLRLGAAGFLLAPGPGVAAEDWSEFRGPTGQGQSAARGIPLRWSAAENVAWKAEIPGEGWSSPVHAAGRVFLTTAAPSSEGDGLALSALALEAATGRMLWRTEVFRQGADAPGIHRKNSHASPTPLIEGQRLFVHFGHQGTACLDLDGRILWSNPSLGYAPVHGNGGSPVVAGDLLVFHGDGGSDPFVAALRKDTGEVAWKMERRTDADRTFSFCTPLLLEVDGQPQIISPGSNVVTALDPADGRELWRVRYEGYSVVPRPVTAHGLVFICTGYDRASLLAIDPRGRGEVTETHVRWRRDKRVPLTPSLLAVGDELYLVADNGVVSCLDARTGEEHWTERIPGNYSASPLHVAGRIYAISEEGLGTVFAPGKTFRKLAENDLGERVLASPAPVDGGLFVRTERRLYRFAAEPGGAD